MLSDNQHVVKALLAVKVSCTLANNKSNNPLNLATSDDYVSRNKRAKAIATMVKASQLWCNTLFFLTKVHFYLLFFVLKNILVINQKTA